MVEEKPKLKEHNEKVKNRDQQPTIAQNILEQVSFFVISW